MHGRLIVQRHVGTEEVVVGNEQSGQGHSAIEGVKAGSGPDMVFEGSVQAFDQLLQCSPLCGFGVQVLEADDLFMLDRRVVISQRIQVVDAGRIGRITVGHEDDLQIGSSGPGSFLHGNNGGKGRPVVGDVIGGDFEALGRNKEENVVMLAQDLDVGFIAGGNGIDAAFVVEIEAVAVKSCCCGIVQHCLIRNPDIEDVPQDGRGFPGRNCERDIEGQDQAKDVLGVMDSRQSDGWFFRG